MDIQIIILVVFGGLFLYTQWRLNNANAEIRRLKYDLNYYQKTFLHRQGGTILNDEIINYDIRSFDAGKTWYAVKNENGELKILEEADFIYPGLLAHLKGWDDLKAYVKENGPIGSNPFTKDDLKVLSDAGFTFSTKKP